MSLLAARDDVDRAIGVINRKILEIELNLGLTHVSLAAELQTFSSLSLEGAKYRKKSPMVRLKKSHLRESIKTISKSVDFLIATSNQLKAEREALFNEKLGLEQDRNALNKLLTKRGRNDSTQIFSGRELKAN